MGFPNILLGETIGTMLLILLGDGVVANVLLGKTKGNKLRLDRHNHGLGYGSYSWVWLWLCRSAVRT